MRIRILDAGIRPINAIWQVSEPTSLTLNRPLLIVTNLGTSFVAYSVRRQRHSDVIGRLKTLAMFKAGLNLASFCILLRFELGFNSAFSATRFAGPGRGLGTSIIHSTGSKEAFLLIFWGVDIESLVFLDYPTSCLFKPHPRMSGASNEK